MKEIHVPIVARATPRDKWFRIVGVPVFVLPFVYYYVSEYGFAWSLVGLTFCWGVLSTAVAWELLRWWVFRARGRYMQVDRTGWRVLVTFVGYAFFMVLLQPVETWVLSQIDPTGLIQPPTARTYWTHIGMAIAFAWVVGGVYEVIYYLKLYRLALTDTEELKRAKLRTELDALRQQVNPHFLFNSLNSLISLIDENPQQAGTYAEELSSVYRYLLRANDAPLVPLSSELQFLDSYYHLLKTRHGEAIQFVQDLPPHLHSYHLPPLTLQLLIENAVKHNVVLPEQPLIITLATDEQPCIVVSNNLQRKPSRAVSNGVGLSNILAKYQMLNQPVPVIKEDGQTFWVTLPLIKSTEATTKVASDSN